MGLKIKSTGLGSGKGWKNEPIRHGLARKGIKTGSKDNLGFLNIKEITLEKDKSGDVTEIDINTDGMTEEKFNKLTNKISDKFFIKDIEPLDFSQKWLVKRYKRKS